MASSTSSSLVLISEISDIFNDVGAEIEIIWNMFYSPPQSNDLVLEMSHKRDIESAIFSFPDLYIT